MHFNNIATRLEKFFNRGKLVNYSSRRRDDEAREYPVLKQFIFINIWRHKTVCAELLNAILALTNSSWF